MRRIQTQVEKTTTASSNTPTTTPTTSKKINRSTRHTVRFDTELMNQVDFLSQHLQIRKLELLRQLVKGRIQYEGAWQQYLEAPAKFVNRGSKARTEVNK